MEVKYLLVVREVDGVDRVQFPLIINVLEPQHVVIRFRRRDHLHVVPQVVRQHCDDRSLGVHSSLAYRCFRTRDTNTTTTTTTTSTQLLLVLLTTPTTTTTTTTTTIITNTITHVLAVRLQVADCRIVEALKQVIRCASARAKLEVRCNLCQCAQQFQTCPLEFGILTMMRSISKRSQQNAANRL